jgi:hypothetical protein
MKIDLRITFTKIFAIIILAVGSVFSFITKNSEVMIFTLSLASGLSGLKNWQEGLTNRKEMGTNFDSKISTHSETITKKDDVKNEKVESYFEKK